MFRYHKESLKSSFCCWICFFQIDKWGDLILGGKHLVRESSILEAKRLTGTGVTELMAGS